jgi:alkaline phosphatase
MVNLSPRRPAPVLARHDRTTLVHRHRRSPMTALKLCSVIAVSITVAGCAATGDTVGAPVASDALAAQEPVRNIILLIADGAGVGIWTAAAYADHDLAVKRMPVVGLVDTRSGSHKVTDSAAGATVFATGERVTNRTVGVGGPCPLPAARDTMATEWPDACGEPLESWFAIARDKGKARGIVTTTSVVDATPAAFVAHSPSRYWHQAIAEQFAEAELDVLLGGGRAYFAGETRSDGRDLLGAMCANADCVTSAAGLSAYRPGDRPLIGLLAPADFYDLDTPPVSLPDMVHAALARLARAPGGFVAMFE